MTWIDSVPSGAWVVIGTVVGAGVSSWTSIALARRSKSEDRRAERLAAGSDALAGLWEFAHLYEVYQAHVSTRARRRRTDQAGVELLEVHRRLIVMSARASLLVSKSTRVVLERAQVEATALLGLVGNAKPGETSTEQFGHLIREASERLTVEIQDRTERRTARARSAASPTEP